MKKTVDNIPFLRLTAALSAGIILGSILQADDVFVFLLLVSATLFLLWLNRHYRYNRVIAFGLGVHLFFLATGIILYSNCNKKPDFYTTGIFVAVVKEILQEKSNSYQSVVGIHCVNRDDSLYSTQEDVLVYFEKDTCSKILLPGQTIVFNSSPVEIQPTGNPFEFDYKRYLERRRIFRQVYLPSDGWLLTEQRAPFSISLLAEQVRMNLLKIYNRQDWNSRQVNVLSALTLGYKRGLSPETKKTFASAGAMHILAVSGLHTGIIFLVMSFLFGFLKKNRTWRFLYILLIVSSLWSFAFITGLSPSVMRAATMFSFVVIGQSLHRRANIYNTLAASAFFLLLLNPNNLFEAGFQLSYAAVFGIVFLQPRLEKLIVPPYILLNYFWKLLTVSVAAQIATFPLAVFYFNQFPVYFWLSNLVIIPAVMVLIPLGISLLVFSQVLFVTAFLSEVTARFLYVLLGFLEWIEQLPHSVFSFYLSKVDLLFLLSALISFYLFIGLRKGIYFKSILMFLLLFLNSSLVRQISGLFRDEVYIYEHRDQKAVHFISGKRNYIVSHEKLKKNDYLHNCIQSTVLGLSLHQPIYLNCSQQFNDSVLYINEGLAFFKGKEVYFYSGNPSEMRPQITQVVINEFRKTPVSKN